MAFPSVTFGQGIALGCAARIRESDGGSICCGEALSVGVSAQVIAEGGRLLVGRNIFVGQGVHIVCTNAITIGDDCLIAEYVTIRDQDHEFETTLPTRAAGMQTAPIVIGNNVWIRAKATITKGVTIRNNVVIGANAVVTKDILNNVIAGGVPVPTCAYTRAVFEKFGPLSGGSIIEDAPLFFRAALIRHFVACDKFLVRQRLRDEQRGSGYRLTEPTKWNHFIQSKIIAFRNMLADLSYYQTNVVQEQMSQIEERLLTVLNSSAGLFISETYSPNLTIKMRLVLQLVRSPILARTFRLHLGCALSLFGFEFHTQLKSSLRKRLSCR